MMTKAKTKKILIIAPAWVGDTLMAQPLFALLKQQQPSAVIDIVAPRSTIMLAQRMPEINDSLELPIGHGKPKFSQRLTFGRSLRRCHYDHAIVLPNTFKSALIPFAAKIKKRTGWLGEQRFALLNDWRKLDKKQHPNLAKRYAMLAFEKSASPTIQLPKISLTVDKDNQEKLIQKHTILLDKKILILCPGAAYGEAKRWPAKYYAEVANYFIKQNWQVLLLGSNKEKDAANTIQQETKHGCLNLCGQTSLLDAIDIMALANAAVTNDSGLMHLAAALHRPLIAIYGSTSPEHTPPLSNNSKILRVPLGCSPCFQRQCPLSGKQHLQCLTAISATHVIENLLELDL